RGGGVASAVARGVGAGRRAEGQAVAAHAVLIALVMSAVFTAGLLLGGPAVYRAMGGTSEAVEAAVTYSHVVFGGAVVYWLLNTLSSIVRGTGTMALPAAVTAGSAVIYLALAPALVLGWGPFPRAMAWAGDSSTSRAPWCSGWARRWWPWSAPTWAQGSTRARSASPGRAQDSPQPSPHPSGSSRRPCPTSGSGSSRGIPTCR